MGRLICRSPKPDLAVSGTEGVLASLQDAGLVALGMSAVLGGVAGMFASFDQQTAAGEVTLTGERGRIADQASPPPL